MTVKWGIMSTARINRLFLAGAREAAGTEILAVASRDAGNAERYARDNAIERAYGSYDDLLADPDVEAVYVSLPNSYHVDWSVRALEAGKHVLCEKPLSRRPAEVDRLFGVAERHDRLLMEAFMYRHHPQTRRLTELLAEGAVGRVRIIRAAFGFVADDPANVRLSAALDGGALMDVGCYCVSGARLIAGQEPERVTAEQALGGDGGVDVAFAATMRFPGDVLAHFDAGLAVVSRDLLEVVGDQGTLRLEDPWHCRRPGIDLLREDASERIEIEPADAYRLETENMSAAIRGEGPLLLDRADALGQARAIEALYRAADDGRAVSLCS
jgi:D-xylose 1-dehydrogenase (NADP+, D-xylono-1,5-lactone-forming)